jgi:hypothetical protein
MRSAGFSSAFASILIGEAPANLEIGERTVIPRRPPGLSSEDGVLEMLRV